MFDLVRHLNIVVIHTHLNTMCAAASSSPAPITPAAAATVASITGPEAIKRVKAAWKVAVEDASVPLLCGDFENITLKVRLSSLGRSHIQFNLVSPEYFGPEPSEWVSYMRDVRQRMEANEPWKLTYCDGYDVSITDRGVNSYFVGFNEYRSIGEALHNISATVNLPLAPGTAEGLLQVIKIALDALEPIPG